LKTPTTKQANAVKKLRHPIKYPPFLWRENCPSLQASRTSRAGGTSHKLEAVSKEKHPLDQQPFFLKIARRKAPSNHQQPHHAHLPPSFAYKSLGAKVPRRKVTNLINEKMHGSGGHVKGIEFLKVFSLAVSLD